MSQIDPSLHQGLRNLLSRILVGIYQKFVDSSNFLESRCYKSFFCFLRSWLSNFLLWLFQTLNRFETFGLSCWLKEEHVNTSEENMSRQLGLVWWLEKESG